MGGGGEGEGERGSGEGRRGGETRRGAMYPTTLGHMSSALLGGLRPIFWLPHSYLSTASAKRFANQDFRWIKKGTTQSLQPAFCA